MFKHFLAQKMYSYQSPTNLMYFRCATFMSKFNKACFYCSVHIFELYSHFKLTTSEICTKVRHKLSSNDWNKIVKGNNSSVICIVVLKSCKPDRPLNQLCCMAGQAVYMHLNRQHYMWKGFIGSIKYFVFVWIILNKTIDLLND